MESKWKMKRKLGLDGPFIAFKTVAAPVHVDAAVNLPKQPSNLRLLMPAVRRNGPATMYISSLAPRFPIWAYCLHS